MAVLYYKFKSAKQFSEFPICERYISVREFKTLIFESKIGRGRDFDLIITNADTGEDYDLESSMILANTKLLIRRIPGLPPKAIVVGAPAAAVTVESVQVEQPKSVDIIKDSEWNEIFASISGSNSSSSSSSSSTLTTVDDSVSQPNSGTIQTTVPRTEIIPREIRKITLGNVNPPNGYICHRCNVAGHFIQHCPTNGDTNYDIKRMKVAGFPTEKEVKKMPSNVNNNIPFEFYCKLCKKIMENSVMTSCCFDSFCDKCIKNFISSNSKCICGITNIQNDNLLPNLTLRNIINGRIGRIPSYHTSIDKNDSKIQPGKGSSSSNESRATQSCISSNKDKDIVNLAAPKRKQYVYESQEKHNNNNRQEHSSKKFKAALVIITSTMVISPELST